jgi:hypothetical protein
MHCDDSYQYASSRETQNLSTEVGVEDALLFWSLMFIWIVVLCYMQ